MSNRKHKETPTPVPAASLWRCGAATAIDLALQGLVVTVCWIAGAPGGVLLLLMTAAIAGSCLRPPSPGMRMLGLGVVHCPASGGTARSIQPPPKKGGSRSQRKSQANRKAAHSPSGPVMTLWQKNIESSTGVVHEMGPDGGPRCRIKLRQWEETDEETTCKRCISMDGPAPDDPKKGG